MDLIILALIKKYVHTLLQDLEVSGYGIKSITQKIDPEDSGNNIITITLIDGTTQVLNIRNGENYVLSEEDKQEIADLVAKSVEIDQEVIKPLKEAILTLQQEVKAIQEIEIIDCGTAALNETNESNS